MWEISMMNLGLAPVIRLPQPPEPLKLNFKPDAKYKLSRKQKSNLKAIHKQKLKLKKKDFDMILAYAKANKKVRMLDIVGAFEWSPDKAKRRLAEMRDDGLMALKGKGSQMYWERV